jgi:hypothetical protein
LIGGHGSIPTLDTFQLQNERLKYFPDRFDLQCFAIFIVSFECEITFQTNRKQTMLFSDSFPELGKTTIILVLCIRLQIDSRWTDFYPVLL